jgi:hypothetical protein
MNIVTSEHYRFIFLFTVLVHDLEINYALKFTIRKMINKLFSEIVFSYIYIEGRAVA